MQIPNGYELTVVYHPSGTISEVSISDTRKKVLVAEMLHSNGVHQSILRLTPGERIQSVYSTSGALVSEMVESRRTNSWERTFYRENGVPSEHHSFSNGAVRTIYFDTNGLLVPNLQQE
jgi:antitoxin component YwqK of YwqJK toxin-antitoxin module